MTAISTKDCDAVIQALQAGVVPRVGQHLIQVGRVNEVSALMQDIDRIASGGTAFRVIIGEYGSGKTFLLNLIRSIGREKKLVTMHADLNPNRRLQGANGQARSLYAELAQSMSTRTKPAGGAIVGVVDKFVIQAKTEAKTGGKSSEEVIHARLEQLTELTNGYAFAEVIAAYCRGFEEENDQLKADAIRWLRGEFTTKTDVKAALGVRSFVDDASVYDQLKLLARFTRQAGFSGLLVCLDELVNLYKLANTQARNSNYEQILRILNDTLQGSAEGLGFILGGTPEFLLDTRRGLYSYPALQSRLPENMFAKSGLTDYSGPVLRLSSLTQEDFYVLLEKLRHVFAAGDPARYLLPDEAIPVFMAHCALRLGDAYFRTPRTTITAFLQLLAILKQHPERAWGAVIGGLDIAPDTGGAADLAVDNDDELSSFQL